MSMTEKEVKPKRAKTSTDEDFGNQSFFEYGDGGPGSLLIDIRPGEFKAWREIVQKVNAHDELVAALKAVCAWGDHPALTGRPDGSPVPDSVPSFDDTVKMVRAALAKAEGK